MKKAPSGAFFLNHSGFLKRSVCAVLFDVAHAVSTNIYQEEFAELRNKNAALREVGLTANFSRRVELSSTRPVAVPSAYLSALAGYFTFACHSSRMLA